VTPFGAEGGAPDDRVDEELAWPVVDLGSRSPATGACRGGQRDLYGESAVLEVPVARVDRCPCRGPPVAQQRQSEPVGERDGGVLALGGHVDAEGGWGNGEQDVSELAAVSPDG
jgi:hypothetical protein